LERTTTPANIRFRLSPLGKFYPTQPAVIAAALKQAASPIPEMRAEILANLAFWKPVVPVLTEAVRTATTDPAAVVRRAAAYQLGGRSGTAADVPRLLALWQDPVENVRRTAFRAVEYRAANSGSLAGTEPPRWTDVPMQQALIRYVERPDITCDEKLTATRRVAEPALLRAWCARLLPEAERLSEDPVPDGNFRYPKSRALAVLATRWVLADRYAELTQKYSSEETYDLSSHPALLAPLIRCIAENSDPAATLAVLREVANKPSKDRSCAEVLLRQATKPLEE
jgi:hypothetical protein